MLMERKFTSCGYCGSDSAMADMLVHKELTPQIYESLMNRGWRRCGGEIIYKPVADVTCCVQLSVRLDFADFTPSKQHRMVLNKFLRFLCTGSVLYDNSSNNSCASTQNQRKIPGGSPFDLERAISEILNQTPAGTNQTKNRRHRFETRLGPSSFTTAKFQLYALYDKRVHGKKDSPPESFYEFLVSSPFDLNRNSGWTAPKNNCSAVPSGPPFPTTLKCGTYHLEYLLDGALLAVSVIDILPHTVSSVYLFYNPDYEFLSIGKLTALFEIQLCRTIFPSKSPAKITKEEGGAAKQHEPESEDIGQMLNPGYDSTDEPIESPSLNKKRNKKTTTKVKAKAKSESTKINATRTASSCSSSTLTSTSGSPLDAESGSKAQTPPSQYFYHLGYYIHTCPKMNYKLQFHPSQALDLKTRAWVPADRALARLAIDPRAVCFPSEESLLADEKTEKYSYTELECIKECRELLFQLTD